MQVLVAPMADDHDVVLRGNQLGALTYRDYVVYLQLFLTRRLVAQLAAATILLVALMFKSHQLVAMIAAHIIIAPAPLHAIAGDIEIN